MRNRPLHSFVLLALLSALFAGCKSGEAPGKKTIAAAAPPAPAAQAAAAVAPTPAPSPAARAAPPSAHDVEWKGNVVWHSWEDAQALAQRENKPILVVLYADWCPHCRALAPAFADPQIESLAQKFVMVRQNNDDDPAWLEPYKKYGGYVPRIFFFDPKGKMREDIVSGHPRYPFFYAAEHIDLLKQSMRRVIGS